MTDTGLQDGMLQYFLSIVAQSDANVEARLEREAFDISTLMESPLKARDPLEVHLEQHHQKIMSAALRDSLKIKDETKPFSLETEWRNQETMKLEAYRNDLMTHPPIVSFLDAIDPAAPFPLDEENETPSHNDLALPSYLAGMRRRPR